MTLPCSGVVPDALKFVIDTLEASPDLTGVDEVSTSLTGYEAGELWIVVSEVPGVPIIEGRLWALRFDLNVYGTSQEEARDTICLALRALIGTVNDVGTDLVVTRSATVTTPWDFTDYINNQPRFACTVELTVRSL